MGAEDVADSGARRDGSGGRWSAPTTGAEIAIALALLVLPLLARLGAMLAPLRDPDVWWHLAAGRWIVDHHQVPVVDPFDSLGEAREWLDYSWSIDVVWWLGYRAIGLAAPLVCAAGLDGLVLVVCALLARADRASMPRRAFLGGAAFVALGPRLTPRTYVVTVLFTGVVLLYVRSVREGGPVRRGVWLLPMFALWANQHVEFVYGWFFLGLAAIEAMVVDWPDRRRALPLLALTAGCVAATLVNPFGVRLLARIATWLFAYGGNDVIYEMHSLPFRQPEDYVLLALFAAAVFAFAQTRERGFYPWATLAFAAEMSFHSRRAAWMIVLVSLEAAARLPILSRSRWRGATPTEAKTEKGERDPSAPLLFAALGASVVVATLAFACAAAARRESLVAVNDFPFAATAFARDRALVGPVFGHHNWGGFLRFALPDVPGNIDGRGTIFPPAEIFANGATWSGAPGWADDAALKRSGFVVADVRTALSQLLRFDARFRVAYEDAVAVVFVRAK